jgi:hypothetical protein
MATTTSKRLILGPVLTGLTSVELNVVPHFVPFGPLMQPRRASHTEVVGSTNLADRS